MLSRRFLLLSTLLAALAAPLHAQTLDKPQGRVVLTVSGLIDQSNQNGAAVFDMAMLERLPQHSFTTRTPWYDKPVKFTGPLLADVLALVKARGKEVHATALNDYTIVIPASDAQQHKPIVARLLDDQPMRVRDKGPLFVVYPFDSDATLRSSTYYERSIWQLKALSVK